MYAKHLTAAALLLVTLLGTAACGGTSGGSTAVTEAVGQTTAAMETEPVETRLYADVPDNDFGGKTFDILTAGNWNNEWTEIYDFQAEEENGEPINDAVFQRNLAIEERYNVEIVEINNMGNDKGGTGKGAKFIEKSVMAIRSADLMIVAGTSLTVYPAAGLINYYRGNRLVLINRDATQYDHYADLVFHERMGNIFEKL